MGMRSEAQCCHRFPEAGSSGELLDVGMPCILKERKMIHRITQGGDTNGTGTIEEMSGMNWLRIGPVRKTGSAKQTTKNQWLTRQKL